MQNKVTCGLFVFLSVAHGDHAEYNRWHSYEHIPEFQVLPTEVHAQRYVATPDLIEARPAAHPDLSGAQYFIAYYHQGPPEAAFIERADHNRWLIENASHFTGQRTVHLTGAYDFAGGQAAPNLGIPPEALPYRPHTGIYVTVSDARNAGWAGSLEAWYERVHYPEVLRVPGFNGVWRFAGRRHPDFPNPPGRLLHIYFLDGDPAEAVAALRTRGVDMHAAPEGVPVEPVIASAFRTILDVPGARYDWFDSPAGRR